MRRARAAASIARMPELPEVETVRRMLETTVLGRRVAGVRISGLPLHGSVPRQLPRALRGRTIEGLRRHGKFLLVDFSGDATLISHLGMSGRWLFVREGERPHHTHVHARLRFADRTELWFQDARRFGMLRVRPRAALARDASLAQLGPDPLAEPPTGAHLRGIARGARVAIKNFLLDQKRIAGLGNIYASEVLHRARVDPRRRAGVVTRTEWERIAAEITAVLGEAVERLGTTFSTYRTLWGEPGGYADRLRVYDRAGAPCTTCGSPIRRIVQGQRSTFWCPRCQGGRTLRTPNRGSRRTSQDSAAGRAPRRRARRPASAMVSGTSAARRRLS